MLWAIGAQIGAGPLWRNRHHVDRASIYKAASNQGHAPSGRLYATMAILLFFL